MEFKWDLVENYINLFSITKIILIMARTTLEDFLKRSIEVHGDKYDYSKVVYKTTETKVTIVCKIHGDFQLRPRAHYSDRRGCDECDKTGKSGFHKSEWADKIKFVYLLELYGNSERFLKFGVTIKGVDDRVTRGEIPYSYTTLFEKKLSGELAMSIEQNIKLKYKSITYKPFLNFRGSTECLPLAIKNNILNYLEKNTL